MKKYNRNHSSSGSTSSRISTKHINDILEDLLANQNRKSTARNYLSIWRQFNTFLIQLDTLPQFWEDRTSLFIAHLVQKGIQSGTIKSYVSGIKDMLVHVNYKWDDSKILLTSLTKACRLCNDHVTTRLPIHCGLLELLLFELERCLSKQWYLECMYKAIFSLGYYGMLRISELVKSDHVVKACNVHMALNKDKLMIMLYSSKTHGEGSRPQSIKIVSNQREKSGKYAHRHFCPFVVINDFIKMRGNYAHEMEQFFIFHDGSPMFPSQVQKMLNTVITNIGLDSSKYGVHSLRIERCTDLIKYGY